MDKTYNLSLTLEEIKLVSGALVELQSKIIADRSWINSQIIKGKKKFTPMLERLLATEGNVNRTLEKVHRTMLEEKMIHTSILDKRWNSYTEREKEYLMAKCRAASNALENGDTDTSNAIKEQLAAIAEFHFATMENRS